jgi:RimJ/RimL family protein N-acetyltransferase
MAWIAGEKVVLRAWEREDVQARWEADQTADPTEMRLRDWHEPPRSLAAREAEFDAAVAEPDESVVALIIEAEGRAVGDINLFEIDTRNRRAAIGLSVWRPDDRNHGYGTDAMRALLAWAFREYNLHRVDLSVDPANHAAIHVYEKLGFVREGCRREAHYTGGAYVDDMIMGLLQRDFTG